MITETESNPPPRLATRAVPYLVILAFTLVFYSPLFLPNYALSMGDYFNYNVPNRAYATQRLRAGDLPQWTDALFGGFPYLADPQPGTFYPPNVILAAISSDLGNSRVMDRFCLLHSIALALGGVFLARSFGLSAIAAVGGGIIISINGFIIMHYGHINVIQGIVSGVWAFGMYVRAQRQKSYAWALGSAMALASCVLAGHPQVPLQAFYAVAVSTAALALYYCGHRCRWKGLKPVILIGAVAIVVGFIAALVQTIPSIEITRISNRSALNPVQALEHSTPIKQLPGILMPGLYQPIIWRTPTEQWFNNGWHHWGIDGFWEHTFHLGIVAFTLGLFGAIANRQRFTVRFLLVSCALLILAALGDSGFIYKWLYYVAPGFKQVRIPPRILWLFMCAWGILAAFGIQSIAAGFVRRDAKYSVSMLAGLALFFALTVGIIVVDRGSISAGFQRLFVFLPNEYTYSNPASFVADILSQLAFTFALGSLICLVLLFARPNGSRAAAILVTALLALELTVYGFHRNIQKDAGFSSLSIPAFNALPPGHDGRTLVLNANQWLAKNTALSRRDISYASGYNPIEIKWLKPVQPQENYPRGPLDENIFDWWNVRYLLREVRSFKGTLRGVTNKFPDYSWVTISNATHYRTSIKWEMPRVMALHAVDVIATAQLSESCKQGSVAANVILTQQDGAETTLPIIFGKDIADWAHASHGVAGAIPHEQPTPLYINPINRMQYGNGVFYGASFDLPTTRVITGVRVSVEAPTPAMVHVSTVRLHSPAGAVFLDGAQALGYSTHKATAQWNVIERPNPCGYAWMVGQAEASSYKQNLTFLLTRASNPFDPHTSVLVNKAQVPNPSSLNTTRGDFSGTATLTKQKPELFTVHTNSNDRGWAVLSHTWTPGWTATLDGTPAKIVQANGAHMAVPVPAGKHKIDFSYTAPGLVIGSISSACAWLLSLLFISVAWFKSQRKPRDLLFAVSPSAAAPTEAPGLIERPQK